MVDYHNTLCLNYSTITQPWCWTCVEQAVHQLLQRTCNWDVHKSTPILKSFRPGRVE
jgi:hypothetical protein